MAVLGEGYQPVDGPAAAVAALDPQLFDAKVVGPNTYSAISIMGTDVAEAGNVLRRLCAIGGEACKSACDLGPRGFMEMIGEGGRGCADANLSRVCDGLGIPGENVLMVGVTQDNIGFADRVESGQRNPLTGAYELPGFNAFFARQGDLVDGRPVRALGRRLADCGDVNLEFADREGVPVMGFMHMTRTNLTGPEGFTHEYDGRKVGSFEYFLRTALDYYGADPASAYVRVAAAIRRMNWPHSFQDEAAIDSRFPGWKTMVNEAGDPLLLNETNPDWQPGEAFGRTDRWLAHFRGMLRWQINQTSDLPLRHIDWRSAIDPGDESSRHASNARGKLDPRHNGRDGYFTVWAPTAEAA